MRVSSRTRPKIVEEKRLLIVRKLDSLETLPPISRDKTITKICDIETDVDENFEEVAENKVLWQYELVGLEENKDNLVFLSQTLLIKFVSYKNLRCADFEEKFLKRNYLKQNQLGVDCVAL